MSSIFGRLGFNFDTNKFGDAQYLASGASSALNASPTVMKTWQQDDIASGSVSLSRYFKNPHSTVCTQISSNVAQIITIATNDPSNTFPIATLSYVHALSNAANNYSLQVSQFKSHTDNISGLGVASANSAEIPTYDLAVGLGQQILKITNTSDGVSNTTPMLGSFTSLFIGSELSANNATVHNDLITIQDLTATNGNCYITDAQVQAITQHIITANSIIAERRTHDWNFYAKSYQVVSDYLTVTRFDNLGNTQLYLVNNFIGTETLVNNLANT